MKHTNFLLTICCLLLVHFSIAQISVSGSPYGLENNLQLDDVPVFITPGINLEEVQQEDEIFDADSNLPYRFGIEHAVELSLENSGTWVDLPNGDRLWRLGINAPQALSINLVYEDFMMPQGARFFLHNGDFSQVLGMFTNRNNKADRQFGTALVYGDMTYLEYYEPAAVRGQGSININMVVHGYRSIKDNAQLGNSGNCNVDTECSQGDNWRDEIKSVGKTIGGGFLCTGVLVGNTTGDCRPLFLTANHCGFFSTTVVYWLFERPNCGSGTPDDTQTTSGVTLVANINGSTGGSIRESDFLLVELSENPVDAGYDVYFAGWDASGDTPQSVTAIHHPRGDAKKISMENQPLTSTNYLSGTVNPNGTHWRVADWDSGTTEGGSSGSPIFDGTTKRIVGKLSGGFAACGNNSDDWYGKFSRSWLNNGSGPNNRLKDWLDPNNTGQIFLDGYSPSSCGVGNMDYTLASNPTSQNSCGANSVDYTIEVGSIGGFSDPVTLSVSGLPTGATSSFSTNPVTPGNNTTLTIGNLNAVSEGAYTFNVNGSASSGNKNITVDLSVVSPNAATLLSPADGATDVSATPTLTWEAEAGADSYDVEVASDAGFANIVASDNVMTTSWMVSPPLDATTTYFWRVRHVRNDCGNDPFSAAFSFTTGENTMSCFTATSTNVPVSIPNSTTISSTINITSSGSISDVNVSFSGTHGRVRDLTFELESPTGTRIQLVDVDDPCNGRQRDFNFGFDDQSTLTIDDDLPCPPTSGLNYQPEQALSTFDGQEVNGTWTLYITDGRNRFTGELQAWQLDICVGGGTGGPTCNDGIQNGLETGIDCGGPDCPPCMVDPTCDDGIQNGLETGIDCGGPDCPPCMIETCDVPTGLFETNNTGNSITLNWTAVTAANTYTIQGRQQGSSNWQLTLTANTNSINVTNNIVAGVTYEWRVRSNCDDGMSDFSVIATFIAGSSTNIDLESRGENVDITTTLQAKIYPSPTSELLNVASNQAIEQLQILDMTGKVISTIRTNTENTTTQLNINYLTNGHYFIRIKSENDVQTLRFVKM